MIFFLISMVVLRPETLTNTKPSDVWRIISNQQPTILMFLWSCEMSSYDAVDVVAPTSSCLYHHSLHMSDLFHFFAAVTNIPFRNWEIFFFYLLPERNLLLLSLCKTLTLECLLKPAKDVQRLALKWFESVFFLPSNGLICKSVQICTTWALVIAGIMFTYSPTKTWCDLKSFRKSLFPESLCGGDPAINPTSSKSGWFFLWKLCTWDPSESLTLFPIKQTQKQVEGFPNSRVEICML